MAVEVRSTSVITDPCERFVEVMQRSAPALRGKIHRAGVFNCKLISGTTTFSQHSWGNAIDLFCNEEDLAAIAGNVVLQATKLTRANTGLPVPVATVIHHQLAWTTNNPRFHVANVQPHTNHVHVEFLPAKTGTPPCAS
jgi:hypothetical protein